MEMEKTHQLRPPGETQWYAPARDITVFTPTAIRLALEEWENPDNVHCHLKTGIKYYTEVDVQDLCVALANFCSVECIVEPDTYVEALKKSGLADVPAHLRMVFMALVGEQFMSAFWVGIRAATTKKAGEEDYELVQYDPEVLATAATRMRRLLRMPPWRRKIYTWWDSFRRSLIKRLGG